MEQEVLVAYRMQKNLTHEQVAEQSGITRQYYGMIENGDRDPSVEVAKKIAAVLGFSWILFFENEGNGTFLATETLAENPKNVSEKEVG